MNDPNAICKKWHNKHITLTVNGDGALPIYENKTNITILQKSTCMKLIPFSFCSF